MKNKVNFPPMALRIAIFVTAFFACGCLEPMAASTTTSATSPTSNNAATTATSASAPASKPVLSEDNESVVGTILSWLNKLCKSPAGEAAKPMADEIMIAMGRHFQSRHFAHFPVPSSVATLTTAPTQPGAANLSDELILCMYDFVGKITEVCEGVLNNKAKYGNDPIYGMSLDVLEVIATQSPAGIARMDAAGYLAERALAGHTDDVAYEKLAVITESLFKYVLSQPCSEKSPEDVNTYAIRYFAMRKFINYVCAMKAMAMEKPDKDTLVKYFEELKKTTETAKAANAKNPEAVEAYDTLLNDISAIISQKDEMFQQLVDMVQIRTLVRDFSAAAWLGDAGEIEKRMTKRSAQTLKASGQKPLEWLFGIKPRSPIRIIKVGTVEVGQQQDRVTVEYEMDEGAERSKSIPITKIDGKWLIGEKG